MKKITKNNGQVVVFEKGQQFWTTSIDIANNFDKTHRDVMRSIKNLTCSTEFSLRNFAQSDYINSRGKKIKMYNITRDGFSFLVMGFTGKDSAAWKERYINAFNRLESAYKRSQDPEHRQIRTDGKRIRRSQTDAIQTFIEYAKENGSGSPKWYYKAFTEMENQLLFIIDKAKSENLRDMLNTEQLFLIGTADQLIAKTIREGIRDEIAYKDIFQIAKRKVAALAEVVGVSEVPATESMLGHNSRHMVEADGQEAVTSCPEPESCKNQPDEK